MSDNVSILEVVKRIESQFLDFRQETRRHFKELEEKLDTRVTIVDDMRIHCGRRDVEFNTMNEELGHLKTKVTEKASKKDLKKVEHLKMTPLPKWERITFWIGATLSAIIAIGKFLGYI